MEQQGVCTPGAERHTKSAGAESPEPFGNGRERFMRSSPGEEVENAECIGLG
jgi:hypothetical protein